ncbi:MAG: DUF4105 domain-containing protein [Pseudomonadales bacterium]|nr:DUF4105 domain-containing protein [Pseudomonadales bacterium]
MEITMPLARVLGLPCLAILLSLLLTPLARADLAHAELIAQQQHLATAPYWLKLLHSQPLGSGWISRARGAGFFQAARGSVDPEAELLADLKGFYQVSTTPDQDLQCLLPARFAWLQQELGQQLDAPLSTCPQFQRWLHDLDVDHLTLVFASDYINNPSSMFGHTLLRLDNATARQDPLLTYSISYAAQTRDSNGLLFAVKGLTGGYPGMYSLLPYYDKVKQYNDMEDRDLWEYPLNLKHDEIQRMLSHIWELRQVAFPYYFFSDNCAYELLVLFELGRPSLQLSADFQSYAIPADTVRAITAVPGLIEGTHYRAASATRLYARVHQQSQMVNLDAEQLSMNPDRPLDESLTDQAASLETAYAVLDTLHDPKESPAAHQQRTQRMLRLLSRRAQLGVLDADSPTPPPPSNPAQGHDSSELYTQAGERQGQGIVNLGWRPAYQDEADNSQGYRPGASIDFMHWEAQYRESDHQVHLNHAVLVDIQSLAAREMFFPSLSWHLALRADDMPWDQYHHINARESHVMTTGLLGAGFTESSTADGSWLWHALIDEQLLTGPYLSRPDAGTGLDLGLTYQHDRDHVLIQLHPICYINRLGCQLQSKFSADHTLVHDISLRLSWERWQAANRALNTTTLGVFHYF